MTGDRGKHNNSSRDRKQAAISRKVKLASDY